MQLPLKKITETASNGHQTTSLLIYTEMLKFVIICTGDAVRCHLFGGRIKTHEKHFLNICYAVTYSWIIC